MVGPGVRPGRRAAIRSVDVAPTVAGSLEVDLVGRDGRPIVDLVPGARWASSPPVPGVPDQVSHGADEAADLDEVAALRREVVELRRQLSGLAAAHHETRRLASEHRPASTSDDGHPDGSRSRHGSSS